MQSSLNILTVEEYLDAEKSSDIRHEYVAGQVFAMAGASEEHNLIAGNIYAILRPPFAWEFLSCFRVRYESKS
jgi:Uma2 family endonuclease